MDEIYELINRLCPNGVQYKEIGEIVNYRRGFLPQPYTNPLFYGGDDAMPFVQVMDIEENGFLLKPETKQNISKIAQRTSVFVPKGTVICSIQGTIGKVAITQYDAYIDRTIAVFESYKININKKYFAYCIQLKLSKEKKNARGVILKTIAKEEFTKFKIPVPPLEVQNEIVKILNNFTGYIVEIIKELDKRKQQYYFYRDELLISSEDDCIYKLRDLLDYIQPAPFIVKNANYSNEYKTPVLTAGQAFVLGYTNEKDGVYKANKNKPVIIFDDFTTATQWVDFNFKVKSSAMKILIPKREDILLKYVYYVIKNMKYIPQQHSRQWIQTFSDFEIALPSKQKQEEVVKILDNFNKLCKGLLIEIEMRQKQYEYYRNKLLNFKEIEEI